MDAEMRSLERSWLAEKDPAVGRRYLAALRRSSASAEVVRALRCELGLFERVRMRTAAVLGYPPAARALVDRLDPLRLLDDETRVPDQAPDPGLKVELHQLPWATELRLRGAVAVARVLGTFERPGEERPRRAIAAAEDWLRCPCDAHAQVTRGAFTDALAAGYNDCEPICCWVPDTGFVNASCHVALLAQEAAGIREDREHFVWVSRTLDYPDDGVDARKDEARRAVSAAIIPWLLGPEAPESDGRA